MVNRLTVNSPISLFLPLFEDVFLTPSAFMACGALPSAFQELLENQGGEPVFIKQFLGYGLYLGGGNLIHLLVEAVNVLLPAIVRKLLPKSRAKFSRLSQATPI